VSSTVMQAYRFALDPSPDQEIALRSHCGAQRFAYNWALARIKANLSQRKAEASYGLEGYEITPPLDWSAYSLRKDWNQVKGDRARHGSYSLGYRVAAGGGGSCRSQRRSAATTVAPHAPSP
jgi:Helix-turn-helix domain